MNEDWERITMRLPGRVKNWLRDRAAKNRRSINSEMVRCIEELMNQEIDPAAGHTSQA